MGGNKTDGKTSKRRECKGNCWKTDDDGDEYRWLQCKTDPKKTAAIFDLQMQLVETMLWKKMRGMMDQKQCRLCSKFKETV